MGGRRARAAMHEFLVPVPKDANGDPRQDLMKIVGGDTEATAPDHQAGAAVELYGYSLPVYPQAILQPGSGQLTEALGAFAVGRAINDSGTRPISITFQGGGGGGGGSLPIGDGFDQTWAGDIELGDPVTSPRFPPAAASDEIASTFAASGGYALLVQRRLRFRLDTTNPGTISNDAEVGGVEVIRYTSRQGNRLRGIQRAAALDIQTQDDQNGFFERGQARQFVTKWAQWMQTESISVNELPNYFLYVVPISIPVSGNVDETPDLVKWVQLYQQGGDDAETEWVRYNLAQEGFVIRAEQHAWDQLRYALTQQTALDVIGVPEGGRDLSDVVQALRDPFLPPTDDGRRRIGYVDPVELKFPACYAARQALAFRGDPFTGTSSHAQPASTLVLPCHRFEFDWPGYGLSAPRAGRSDRVALVQGTARAEGHAPGVEWHTVNWAVRHYGWDAVNEESTSDQPDPLRERQGDWPFQLVAFQGPLRAAYLGLSTTSRDEANLQDSRFLDRIVKFPSGELPAAEVDVARIGASAAGDYTQFKGLVDEVALTARAALARPLDQNLGEEDSSFFVRPDVAMTPQGVMVQAKPRQWADYGRYEQFPETGGLLMIDGEILAFESYAPGTGEVTVAPGGRGLLGTQARGHDEGAVVQFLEQVPAGILASSFGERDRELELQALGGLPRDGGTVLVGTELLHYTWTTGDTTLAMPGFVDPESSSNAERGVFRGRYGTTPTSVAAGTPVIRFPFRYWDRHRDRVVDPESSFVQFTLDDGPAYFESFGWEEDLQDAQIDLKCYVRIDGHGKWSDDPDTTDGLYLFDDGQPDGKLNPIQRYGERFEARFVQVFEPGAFDPVEFRAQAWKKAPTLRSYVVHYAGETRILSERVTAR